MKENKKKDTQPQSVSISSKVKAADPKKYTLYAKTKKAEDASITVLEEGDNDNDNLASMSVIYHYQETLSYWFIDGDDIERHLQGFANRILNLRALCNNIVTPKSYLLYRKGLQIEPTPKDLERAAAEYETYKNAGVFTPQLPELIEFIRHTIFNADDDKQITLLIYRLNTIVRDLFSLFNTTFDDTKGCDEVSCGCKWVIAGLYMPISKKYSRDAERSIYRLKWAIIDLKGNDKATKDRRNTLLKEQKELLDGPFEGYLTPEKEYIELVSELQELYTTIKQEIDSLGNAQLRNNGELFDAIKIQSLNTAKGYNRPHLEAPPKNIKKPVQSKVEDISSFERLFASTEHYNKAIEQMQKHDLFKLQDNLLMWIGEQTAYKSRITGVFVTMKTNLYFKQGTTDAEIRKVIKTITGIRIHPNTFTTLSYDYITRYNKIFPPLPNKKL